MLKWRRRRQGRKNRSSGRRLMLQSGLASIALNQSQHETAFIWIWRCTPEILALGRLRQEDYRKFKASLDCIVRARPANLTGEIEAQFQNKQTKKKRWKEGWKSSQEIMRTSQYIHLEFKTQ